MANQGCVPPHDHGDSDVREALAQALGERKLRMTDRRLLIMYIFIVALVAGTFFFLSESQKRSDADRREFQRVSALNCESNRQNTINFNDFISKLQQTYRTSPALSPAERLQRVTFFETAKQEVPTCPPSR